MQFSVIHIIYCNACLKCSLKILSKCLFVIITKYAYFNYISQGSVDTHLWCGGICNKHIIANCPQSVSEWILKIGH